MQPNGPALPTGAMPAAAQSTHGLPSKSELSGYSMRMKPSPALRSYAGTRLVSNFSPLTLPSTPGSSGYSRRYASSANDNRFSAEPEMVQQQQHQFIDIVTSYDEGDDADYGNDMDSVASNSNQSSDRFSAESGMSRPLTQTRGSGTSLSLYSAASERDDARPHEDGADEIDFDVLSDGDIPSDDSDDREYAEALTSIYSMHSNDRWQNFPIPQPKNQHHQRYESEPAKHSSLPYALDHPFAETQSSIYMLPRYAACSQDILGSASSLFNAQHLASGSFVGGSDSKENVEPIVPGPDVQDWESDGFSPPDGVDSGSVISQEISSDLESPLTDQEDEIDEVTEGFIRLDVSRDSSASESASDDLSSMLFGSTGRYSASSEGSDVENGNRASQDTVLYVGRLYPGQGYTSASTLSKEHMPGTPRSRQSTQDLAALSDREKTSLDSLHLSPMPVPQSVRCAVAATYPQKIMKWSQQTRSDRASQSKDSLRMVESLRRMGKWQNTEPERTVDELNRANQFFYDPVIIAMSPRLMPQSGQPS
ncbi:hypothetical protein GGF43_005095 [Coemansia sp. RSA 2618]|nr:hypothetical protein GGF43_005095 [Coemansia sp. RSA 2618]